MALYLAKLVLLVQVLILSLLGAQAMAQSAGHLPLPERAKDLRYLEKDPAKRKAFFEAQKKLLSRLLKELQGLKPKDKKAQKTLKEAQELLENLPFLWQKIEFEAGQKLPPALTLPPLPKKAPGLSDLKEFVDFGFQLNHQIETLKGKRELEKEELDRLEKTLEEVFRNYLLLAQKGPSPEAYLKLAELLNLQARYALAKLELERTAERLNKLISLENDWEKDLAILYEKVKIRPKEVAELKKEIEKTEKDLENLKKTNQALREELARKLALLEIRLTKLHSSQTPYKRKFYETRKDLYETRTKILEVQEDILGLKLKRAKFWYDFAAVRAKLPVKERPHRLEDYETQLEALKAQEQNLVFRLNYLEEKTALIKGNLRFYQEERAQKPKNYLGLLIKESQDLLATLNTLKNLLQKKKEALRTLIFEEETLLFLWKSHLSLWQRGFNRFKKIYQRSATTVKAILYYPLWKSGETTFTVLSFFKLVFVLTVGLIVLKLIRRRIERFLVKHLGMAPGVVNSLSTLSYYLMICLLALVALSTAGINMSQIALIFGALSVGIGFGLQTIANNFVSGIILLSERSIKVGDLVQFEDGTIGVVKKINIRSTVIRTFDALEIIVPNSEFISQRISTWTYDDDWRRILIPFGVAYGTDPEKVREVATKAARSVPITREDPAHPIRVRFVGFGESSLDFELAVWIRQSEVNRAMTGIKSDYYYALHKALTEAGIEIPFPQRDIHLRSIYPEALKGLSKIVKGEGP